MVIKRVTIFFIRKCITLVALLLAVSILSYILMSVSPIDPVQSYIGADMTRVGPEQRDAIAAYWGLDESKPKQFLNWAQTVIQGDLGSSLIYRAPVSSVIV